MKQFFKFSFLVVFAVMGSMLIGSTLYAQTFQTAPMNRIDGTPLPPWAQATLTRHGAAGYVEMTIHTQVGGELWDIGTDSFIGINWKPKDAATNWWVVFNEPGRCTVPCGRDDVLAQATGDYEHSAFGTVGVHWATGHITTSGQWSSAATLWEGDTDDVLFGEALADADAAEIHLIVRSHGRAENLTPEELADAQTTINGGCPPNACDDPQDAVFPPLVP